MRPNRTHGMGALVAALVMVSARAAAEPATAEPAAEPAAPAPTPAPATRPTPRVAAAPASGDRANPSTWHEGFQVTPMIGVNSIQGDAGQNTGPGLRLGLLAGSRLTELLSLNIGFAFDLVNMNVPAGATASQYAFDVGFNPLLHFPLPKLEIVAGPLAGVFVDYSTLGIGAGQSTEIWTYGWTAGVNAGVLFPVGSKARLGALANFYLRNPIKACVTGADMCISNANSINTLALSFAAML
jgi:hypothetical protein